MNSFDDFSCRKGACPIHKSQWIYRGSVFLASSVGWLKRCIKRWQRQLVFVKLGTSFFEVIRGFTGSSHPTPLSTIGIGWTGKSENTQCMGWITIRMVSSFTGLYSTRQENMVTFVIGKSIESKPVEQEASCTVILPVMVSVSWWTGWSHRHCRPTGLPKTTV